MIYKIIPLTLLFLMPFTPNKASEVDIILLDNKIDLVEELTIERIYNSLNVGDFTLPQLTSFEKAVQGFYEMKTRGEIQKNILTIIDFSLSSSNRRLWVIDMDSNTVLYQSLVSHGRNTGEEYAEEFSNEMNSNKSSLGFYLTGETYLGKNGFSLRLDGLEIGVNDKARNRGIVVHGADYVSEDYIKENGRLGRSQGCPAIPMELRDKIIDVIKEKTCLFIYYPAYQSKLYS